MVLEPPAGSCGSGVALAVAGPRREAAVVAAARPPHEEVIAAYAGRIRVLVGLRRQGAVARASRASLCIPGRPYGVIGVLRAGGIPNAAVRRQFQLARTHLVSDEFPHCRVAAEIS